ncbi:MAG: PCRF domain-containing protein, partial [Firmicutes bacterium]|nr:PCRF domain-containing protein [Bacillota bacterium]
MRERLEIIKKRYAELNTLIADPKVVAQRDEWQKLVKEHSVIEPVALQYEELLQTELSMEDCKLYMGSEDRELAGIAEEEFYSFRDKRDGIEAELKVALLPKDPLDDKN